MYKFKTEKIDLNTINGIKSIETKHVNVIIGPNNSGKSRLLKELRDWLSGDHTDIKIIKDISYSHPNSYQEIDSSYGVENKLVKDIFGNFLLRTYLNKSSQPWDANMTLESYYTRNLNSVPSDWRTHFENVIHEKNHTEFFRYFGPLFFQYIGTEERLTICKKQKNYGLDSSNTNYLTSFKFEDKVLDELAINVKRIFHKDIILDTQTLGD